MPSTTHGTVTSMEPSRMSKLFWRITIARGEHCVQVASADADAPGVVSPAFRRRISPTLFVMFCGAFEVSL